MKKRREQEQEEKELKVEVERGMWWMNEREGDGVGDVMKEEGRKRQT